MLLRIFLLLIVTLTGGCAFVDGDHGDRAVALNHRIDEASNDTILTNIIRASYEQPLAFSSLSKLSGEQSLSVDTGLPTVTIGPNLPFFQNGQAIFGSNKLSNSAKGTLEVGTLASKNFTAGMSARLSPVEMAVLIGSGFPRRLLFQLIIESVEYIEDKKRVRIDNNPRNSGDYNKFLLVATLLEQAGLTAEQVLVKGTRSTTTDKPPNFQVSGNFCFNSTLGSMKSFAFDDKWRCKRDNNSVDLKEFLKINKGEIDLHCHNESKNGKFNTYKTINNITFNLRSVYGIYYYLGDILRYGEGELNTSNAVEYIKKCEMTDVDLVRFKNIKPESIVQLGIDRTCFATAKLYDKSYCVPASGSNNTRRMFAVLSQLQALRTDPTDLPYTPTVRVQGL